ncbi:Serine/threonine-protein kinase ATM [Chlorella vulgaris]
MGGRGCGAGGEARDRGAEVRLPESGRCTQPAASLLCLPPSTRTGAPAPARWCCPPSLLQAPRRPPALRRVLCGPVWPLSDRGVDRGAGRLDPREHRRPLSRLRWSLVCAGGDRQFCRVRALQLTINRGADNRRTGSHFNYLRQCLTCLFGADHCVLSLDGKIRWQLQKAITLTVHGNEALKQLLAILDSPAYLQALDEATVALRPDAPVPGVSWPGLAHVVTKAVADEVQAAGSRKKGPDPSLQRAFRLVMTRAEEGERRCGHGRLLLRRAGSLFRHVSEVLQAGGPASPIGLEYSAALRNQLLTVPEYCACSTAPIFQALLAVHMDFMEKQVQRQGLGRSADDAGRSLAAMAALLAAFPGDMQPVFQADCLLFFSQLAEQLGQLAEAEPSVASRLLAPTLNTLNAFLLGNGRDVAAQLPALHAAYHDTAIRGSGRDARLREAAVTYLRIQLQLGTLPRGSAHLQDVQDWVDRELGLPAFKWGEDSREGRLVLPRQQAALLDLAAATYFCSSGGSSGRDSSGAADVQGFDDLEAFEASPLPAAKRRRHTPLLSDLAERAASKPANWAPVLSRLLLSYGLGLPPEAYADWLAQLAAAAPSHFPRHFMPDEHDAVAALWLLRLAHALAVAWPLHLGQGTGRAAQQRQQGAEELPSPAVMEEQWMAVWEGVMGYAKAPNVHPASFAAALPVLGTLARRRLVQVPPGFHKLWGLPLLQQIPSPAGLDFLTAAALSGRDAAIDGSAWQPAFLQWLRAAPGAAAPAGLAAAIAAVLRLPELPGCKIDAGTGRRRDNSSGSNASPSLSRMPAEGEGWWHWWHDDSTLAAQLAGLIRGEALMQARRLMLIDGRQQAATARQLRPEQVLAGLAPVQLQQQAADVLEERLEDVLRQAPSPAPPTSLHAQYNSRLAQLLSSGAAAVSLSTQAAAASQATQRPVPACWLPEGALAAKLVLALTQCGNLLAEACKRLEGLFPAEQERLEALVAALHDYGRELASPDLANSLLQCMGAVQDLFLDASSAVGEAVRATQAAAATRGMAAATVALGQDFFDDDLDVGGRAPTVTRSGGVASTAAVSSSASLAAACKQRCAALLALLGPLHPANGSAAALHWLEKSWEPGRGGLPEEAHLALVDTLVQCAVRAMSSSPELGADYGLKACLQLGAEQGLLKWVPRHHNGRCLFAMRNVRQLVAAAAAVPPASAGAVQGLLQELVQVADDCFVNLSDAESKGGAEGQKVTAWPLRVALAEAFMALFAHNHRLLPPDVLASVQEYMKGMLSDESYGARLAGSRLVQVLFEKYSEPQAVFAELKHHLTLDSIALGNGDNREQQVETSLFMLAETAASCGGVELECFFLLCGHVASGSRDRALVAATLDWLAACLGYPHRHAYAAWHQRGLLFEWVSNNWSLLAWCNVQTLVAPTPEAAAADTSAFLAACAPTLTAMLVWGERQMELAAVAEQLRVEPAALVAQHFEVLMAIVYPYSLTGKPEERQMAAQKLTGPVMAALLPVPELKRLIKSRLVGCAAQMLLMARGGSAEGEPEPPHPWFSGRLVVRAVNTLADMGVGGSGSDKQAQQRALLDKMLSRDHLAAILLVTHAHLELAKHPRHQAHALSSLQALLVLLEGRVCQAATLRYTVSIVLRLLSVRELQSQCCAILSSIVSHMLQLPAPEDLAPLGSLLPAVLSTLVEGVEAEHSAGRPLGTPAVGAMLDLVAQLTSGAPPGLQPFLRQVDPLPENIPALQQPAALVAAARRDITPSEQLLQARCGAASCA